jgi:hypothetical protein
MIEWKHYQQALERQWGELLALLWEAQHNRIQKTEWGKKNVQRPSLSKTKKAF